LSAIEVHRSESAVTLSHTLILRENGEVAALLTCQTLGSRINASLAVLVAISANKRVITEVGVRAG
jgi:hypothetical protein